MQKQHPFKYICESLLDDVEIDEVEDNDDDIAEQSAYEIVVVCKSIRERRYCNLLKDMMTNFLAYHKDVKRTISYFDSVHVDFDDRLKHINIHIRFSGNFILLRTVNMFLFDMCLEIESITKDAYYKPITEIEIAEQRENTKDKPLFVFPSGGDAYILKENVGNFYRYFIPGVTDDEALREYLATAIQYNFFHLLDEKRRLYSFSHEFGLDVVNDKGEMLTNSKFDRIYDYKEGFAVVKFQIDKEWNIIDINGNLLRPEDNYPLLATNGFNNGYIGVSVYDVGSGKYKCNFMDKNCKMLFAEPFDDFDDKYYDKFGLYIVSRNDKFNFLNKDYELTLDFWFDAFNGDKFVNGFIIVKNDDGKCNYVNTDGKLVSKKWFKSCDNFISTGVAIVYNKRFHIITKTGKLLNNGESFESAYYNDKGDCIKVSNNGKYNLMSLDGKYLLKDWYHMCDFFRDGIANVYNENSQANFANERGELISDVWYCMDLGPNGKCSEGFVRVKNEESKYNFIGRDGKLLSPNKWFYSATKFSEGFGKVVINDDDNGNIIQTNYIDKNGNLITNEYIGLGEDFCNGFAKVMKKSDIWFGRCINYLKPDGSLLSVEWFKDGENFNENGFAKVLNNNNKENFLCSDGTLLYNIWFDNINHGFDDYNCATVKLYGIHTVIDKNGNILFDGNVTVYYERKWKGYVDVKNSQNKHNMLNLYNGDILYKGEWFDDCTINKEKEKDYIIVTKDKKYNFLRPDGSLFFNEFVDKFTEFDNNGIIEIRYKFSKNYVDFEGNMLCFI